MKMRSLAVPTIFLQAVIVLIGIGALALMLWEPHIEGRNAHATLFEIYFNDPFFGICVFSVHSIFCGALSGIQGVGIHQTKQGILAGDRESSADYQIFVR
jgi:hypothetical protein